MCALSRVQQHSTRFNETRTDGSAIARTVDIDFQMAFWLLNDSPSDANTTYRFGILSDYESKSRQKRFALKFQQLRLTLADIAAERS
jgi:hypothetical protein